MKIEIDTTSDVGLDAVMNAVSRAVSLQCGIKINSYTQVKIGTFLVIIKCISKDYILIKVETWKKIERRRNE